MRRGIMRAHTAQRVIIAQRDSETTIGGWLEETGKDGYLLRAPHLLMDEGVQPLDGELFIPHDRVAFVQLGASW